jgi:hypothetical protein
MSHNAAFLEERQVDIPMPADIRIAVVGLVRGIQRVSCDARKLEIGNERNGTEKNCSSFRGKLSIDSAGPHLRLQQRHKQNCRLHGDERYASSDKSTRLTQRWREEICHSHITISSSRCSGP